MTITNQITALLAADPACNGRVTGETVRAIAGVVSERAAIVAWLREDAGKTREDVRRMHARRQLTPAQTAEWESMIALKSGLADAIERGDFGAGEGKS